MKKTLRTKKHVGGQALLISVIFFLVISMTIIIGITEPIVRQLKVVQDYSASARSFYLSEALTEDILYRLNNNLTVGSSEELIIDSSEALSAVTTVNAIVTSVGSQKIITTTASVNNLVRKSKATVTVGDGMAFNYGIQTGNGGFTMGNTAKVVGNVYSNGNISGGEVTGTVIAANSISLITDQANDAPATPALIATFGTSATQDIAQSFKVSTTSQLNNVQLYIRKSRTQNPADITVRIVADNNGSPSNTVIASQTVAASQISTTQYGWKTVTFSSNPTLTKDTTYWLILDASTDATDYYFIGANTTYSNGVVKSGTYNSSLSASTTDIYFKISLGGLTSTISNVIVGEDAWAHSISGGSVAGTKYCQSGTGCNTSRPDPTPEAFPISEANISDWQSDAAAGGVISGNYTPAEGSTIGPKKITGDLIISNNFTITGTLWVMGNIVSSNGKTVRLSSAFGNTGAVIVVDGTTNIANNSQFIGSGSTGSYIMIVSKNSSSNAITVNNNAGTVILNAQYGTIHFNNNAEAKEATGYSIVLDNGAIVKYDSGLSNASFTSGPGGAWNIDSWQEIQ